MSKHQWLDHDRGIEKITKLGREGEPFLFILSYDKQKIFAESLNRLDGDIYYKLEKQRNYPLEKFEKTYSLSLSPISFEKYQKTMEKIVEEICSGNTYLLNLTFQTPIHTNLTLKEIFSYAKAKFKLYFKGEFICFSPEQFIEMSGDSIATYPMKGTIEASLPNAKREILNNPKEMAEHTMIVDLMRNDLGIIGSNVEVKKF
jgi:para-aminobenzoate synthetase component 1